VPAVPMRVRMAGPEIADWDDLVALRRDIEQWRASNGQQQRFTAAGLAQLARFFDRGEVRMVTARDGTLAGSLVLTRYWDRALWADDPERGKFLYLHTMMTAPAFRGQGLSRRLVALAMTAARTAGLAGVRLDCTSRSPEPRALWEQRGFTYLRTVPGQESGVLMERRRSSRPEGTTS
jgi:GNAT superfamily N-acetyltransferase